MAKAGQPSEITPFYVFWAYGDSLNMTSQVLLPNGGEIFNA